MKTDINGASTCQPGQEHYEHFRSKSTGKRWMVQYDYRTPDGHLFSCVSHSLEIARQKRDAWLEQNGYLTLPSPETLCRFGRLDSITRFVGGVVEVHEYEGRFYALETSEDGTTEVRRRNYK